MSMRNRLANCHNRYQDHHKFPRTLCVCSAGLLRAPTIAFVLSNPPYNCNVRAAGCNDEYALVPVDDALIEWADRIVFADTEHCDAVDIPATASIPTYNLRLPDSHCFRDPELIELIKARLEEAGFPKNEIVPD
jgi:predicted protein tyrosine phosphatase